MAVKSAKKKDPAAAALGRKGGKKGGPARAAKLTPVERSASKAVKARWAKLKAKESADYIVNKGAASVSGIVSDPSGKTPDKGETADMNTVNEFRIDEARRETSDRAFMSLLKRYKATNNPTEMEALSEQIEKMIFHKQHENVKA